MQRGEGKDSLDDIGFRERRETNRKKNSSFGGRGRGKYLSKSGAGAPRPPTPLLLTYLLLGGGRWR